jgi:hypothetical protein
LWCGHIVEVRKLLKGFHQLENGSVGYVEQIPSLRKNLEFLLVYPADPAKERIYFMAEMF